MKLKLFVVLLFCANSIFSQYDSTLTSDRPGQALSAFTVGKKIFQIQSGYQVYGEEKRNSSYDHYQTAEVNLRFGIVENVELGFGLIQFHSFNSNPTDFLASFADFSFSLRSNILKNKGIIPSVGYQVSVDAREVLLGEKELLPKITIITNQNLTKRLSLSTNLGSSWNYDNGYFYVINLGYSINNKLGVFVENYGTFAELNYFEPKYDGGFSYLINNNFQIDFFGGYFKDYNDENNWFGNVGITWRTNRKSE